MREKIVGQFIIEKEKFSELSQKIINILDYKQKIEESLGKNITELLEIVFGGAVILKSSDIHIEPLEEKTKLRIRIDGLLYDVCFFEKNIYKAINSRIKLLSGLKLNITDVPQDGRFTLTCGLDDMEIRTSTLPAEWGESIVLRILNPKSLIKLKDLGLVDYLLKIFEKEIKKPNGMIIVTGPTGSGKTTTLYAILKEIQKPEIKIITIEDPIEYHLEGISQTQVDPLAGYDFANGLAAIVRQDPDVILVGEIRDSQTTKIALQASLTGHLVLSTLHTNDAAGAIPRLISLGAQEETIASALNMVVAQRLIRKLCEKCKKFQKATPQQKDFFKNTFSKLPKIPKELLPSSFENLKIPKAVGCPYCNFTGYAGRKGVFEVFLISEELQDLILKKAAVFQIKKAAINQGMIPMFEAGLLDVLSGITTFEEIQRAIGEK